MYTDLSSTLLDPGPTLIHIGAYDPTGFTLN